MGLEPALAERLAFSLPRGQPRFTGRVEREVTKLPVIQDGEPGRLPARAVSFCRLRAIGWRPGPWPAQGAVPGTGGDQTALRLPPGPGHSQPPLLYELT